MTREDQIKKAAEIIAYGCSDELKAALIQDFPELRESEDEMIRKSIIQTLEFACAHKLVDYDAVVKMKTYLEKQKENIEKEYVFRPLAGTDITIAAEQAIRRAMEGDHLVLAFNGWYIPVDKYATTEGLVDGYYTFIEKQKEEEGYEAIPIENTLEYKAGFHAGKEFEKQQEQTSSIPWVKSDNVTNPDKPYIDKAGWFYTTDGRMCLASEIEKQKEQKPVDYDHEMWKNCEANFEGGKKEVIDHPEKYGLQKDVKVKYVYPKFRIGDVISCNKPEPGFTNDYTIVGFNNELPDYLVDGGNVPSCSIGIEFIASNYHLKEQKPAERNYDNRIQYDSVKSGIESFASMYSFNIESKLFPQLAKEQQQLWREEIERAVIAGGEYGIEISRDKRYKENKTIEWSEEDERMLKSIIGDLFCGTAFNMELKFAASKKVNWLKEKLKSLCERFNSKKCNKEMDLDTKLQDRLEEISRNGLENAHTIDFNKEYENSKQILEKGVNRKERSTEFEEAVYEILAEAVKRQGLDSDFYRRSCDRLLKLAKTCISLQSTQETDIKP